MRPGSPEVLDEDLLAVAPFDAVSSGVAEYREGLVTILSRSLDGAGPLRTISPTVVVRRWVGQSDPTSASALGHSTGAGLVVFGQVLPAGADSVRLSATIYDVRRERPLGEVEVRDERHRIDRIADTLAVRLLREVGRTRRSVRCDSLRWAPRPCRPSSCFSKPSSFTAAGSGTRLELTPRGR